MGYVGGGLLLAVLVAMTCADPESPDGLDSPAQAVLRRLPNFTVQQAAGIVGGLSALRLTKVPHLERMMPLEATADLTQWITDEGWEAVGGSQRREPSL
jgi:hypothetical protein